MKQREVSVYIISENELVSFCRQVMPIIKEYHLILLYGQMGSGKTRFVRALGEYMGFLEEVGSPSFSIINEYHVPNESWQIQRLFHIDLYRLKSTQEALDIGIIDYLDTNQLCIIEWPQLIESLVSPSSYLSIEIEVLENQQRRFILTV